MKKLAILFLELFKISLFVIGGGYAIIAVADQVFAKRGWTEEGELVDKLPIFQMVPGLIATHVAVYVGDKVAGRLGSAVGVLAVALPSVVIFTFVSMGYKSLPLGNPWLDSVFVGLRSALTGIIAATVVRGWRKNLTDSFAYAVLFAAVAAIGILKLNVAIVLVTAMAAGIIRTFAGNSAAKGERRFNATWLPLLLFLKYGALCFGGGFVLVPMYIEDFVGPTAAFLQISPAEFGDLMALTQMTPGPIGVNGATFFGYRLAGVPGAVLASAALLLPGSVLCYAVIRSLERFKASRWVQGILRGVRPASVALMLCALGAFAAMSVVTLEPGGEIRYNLISIALSTTSMVLLMKKKLNAMVIILVSALAAGILRAEPAKDAMSVPELRNVRLQGYPAQKMNDLFRERVSSEFAQRNVFGEARRAFVERDDDERGHGGLWRGEFWGKLMLSAARVADYLNDPAVTKFIVDECHRMIDLQDPDGYLGSYKDKELVSITDPETTKKTYGWYPCWNIWNRKYAMWGMLMAYKATGDKEILASVERQMNQLIDMLHRLGLKLHDTGTANMYGLPSMSLLKPIVMLYEETGNRKYLDFAAEMLPDWDRDDGQCPNFFRNAKLDKPLNEWYPDNGSWDKTYEFLSCTDGLIEYYRATGDRRCLETAKAICDNLAKTDANPFGGVGFGDHMIGAVKYCNALNEVCDVIHWIRLNVDIFLTTGEKKYLDAVETAYFNGYLAGIWRGGAYGPFFLRGHGRHTGQRGQCGYAYNHCCVNNLPRTFMDVAQVTVTRDAAGTFHVNLYQDATVELYGVKFEISGNYPVDNVVTVKVSDPAAKVEFRKPAWCPKMQVLPSTSQTSQTCQTFVLSFDMNARIVDRLETVPELNVKDRNKSWAFKRYPDHWCGHVNRDLIEGYRTTPAAQVMWGPLVLTKSRLVGNTKAEIVEPFTVNGKGYSVKATPVASDGMTWGRWDLELTKPGERAIKVKACDFESGSDVPCGESGDLFSIWF